MIFPNHCQKLTRICLYTPAFSTNMTEIVKSFRHTMLVVYTPKVANSFWIPFLSPGMELHRGIFLMC